MSSVADELHSSPSSPSKFKSIIHTLGKILIFFLFTILLGIYVGNVLFGSRSLETLMALNKEQEHLKNDIERLKNENAAYQKQSFEYQQLTGTHQ